MKSTVFFLLGLLISMLFVPIVDASYSDCTEAQMFDDTKSSYSVGDTGVVYHYDKYWYMIVTDIVNDTVCTASTMPSYNVINDGNGKVIYMFVKGDECGLPNYNWSRTRVYLDYITDDYTTSQCDPLLLPSVEPGTCSNGQQDSDEVGIDCGGPCSATCEEICPPNTENLIGFDGQPGCFWYGLKDNFGNCPDGTTAADDQGYPDACYKSYSTILAVSGTEVDAVDDLNFTAGSLSTVEQVYPSAMTDNGDGTSSKTTITERVGPGGETTTTTKTDVIDNTTGEVLSSTTNTEQEIPIEENPDNYSYDIGDGDLPDSEFVDLPAEKDFDSLFDQINSWNPFSNMDDEMKITVANPTCSFGCDIDLSSIYLGSHTLEFGLCEYEWAFNAIGVVLNFGAVFLSFCIVVRG